MKAIYINLDPYITAIVAWINGGFVGHAPTFQPLPLAVTIPLGETPVLIVPAASSFDPEGPIQGEGDWDAVSASVNGVEFMFKIAPLDENSVIASALKPGLSSVVPNATYAVTSAGTSGTIRLTADVIPSASEAPDFEIPFTILVRREAASGPVDLVDFTPPSSGGELTAAAINTALGGTGAVEGSPLKGVSLTDATGAPTPSAADINSVLAAAGPTALAGVQLGGAIIRATGREEGGNTTMFIKEAGEPGTEAFYPLFAGEGVVDQIGGDGVS